MSNPRPTSSVESCTLARTLSTTQKTHVPDTRLVNNRIEPSLRLRRAFHAIDALLVQRILRSHPGLLHNADATPSGLSNSNLHLAASLGHLQICKLLVSLGSV